MKDYPLEKYRFYQAGNKIIAVSRYANKTVRGVAVCHPDDKFDIELGKRLAAARCNEKVAAKRYARATQCYKTAEDAYRVASENVDRMSDYRNDAFIAMNEASQAVDSLIAKMRAHS